MSNLNNNQKGFSLIELLVVLVIFGATAAVATPSLVLSWRQNKANQSFNEVVSALQSAQANANRMSVSCVVTVATTGVTAAPQGCLQENVSINTSIISVTPSGPTTVTFNFKGETTNDVTFTIARKNGNGTADTTNANCVVISPGIGLIRTGKLEGTNTCKNIQNERYPN